MYIHFPSLLLLLSCPTSILILRCLDPNIYLKSFIKSYTNVMSISLTLRTTFNPSISHYLLYSIPFDRQTLSYFSTRPSNGQLVYPILSINNTSHSSSSRLPKSHGDFSNIPFYLTISSFWFQWQPYLKISFWTR
jgi:hypothetical protein